jgi:hypothetical protein
MKASTRHKHHGKPQARQKPGRRATTSHRLNFAERRRPKELRPVAESRCTAPTHGPRIEKKSVEPPKKLVITYACNECHTALEYEGQGCTKTDYWTRKSCPGKAVKTDEEVWVEI